MGKPDTPLSSGPPDPRILALLGKLQSACLFVALFVAAATFLGWLFPPFARVLPHGWDIMKVNTTVLIGASCLCLFLWQPRRSRRALQAARVIAGAVTLLASATLFEYFAHISLHIDTLLAADASSLLPGRLSAQTAWAFLLIGLILSRLRVRKRTLATVIDILTLALTFLTLIFLSGYFFGALHLYGLSLTTRMAPMTLVCISLLTFVILTRRSEYGIFSILLGSGIGGRTARLATPWVVCFPFILTILRGLVLRFSAIPPGYTLAVSASLMSMCGFCLVLALSRRTDRLENAIRELSLRDDLTKLYNRRGFYLLAEQMMRLTHRARDPFFVLFIDMDNLKLINDTYGHDIGSEQLKQLAAMIDSTLRDTDVVGRLGGDEFVVAGKGDEGSLKIALDRLQQQTSTPAATASPAGKLEFSFGYVISRRGSAFTLDDLIEQADAIMYNAKRNKKAARASGLLTPALGAPSQSAA